MATLFWPVGAAQAQNGIYNVTNVGSALFGSTPNSAKGSRHSQVSNDGGAGPVEQFTSRYALNVNADVNLDDAPRTQDAQVVHQVNFEVHSTGSYELVISTALVGELTRGIDSEFCTGSADITGVTGGASHELTSGSLNLDDPGELFAAGVADRVDLLKDGSAVIRRINPPPVETFALGFSWIATATSDSCEAAVRLGAQNPMTEDCAACGYPGTPARDQAIDGHYVNVFYAQLACGNGNRELGEECDDGLQNGTTCCDTDCRIKPDRAPCNDGLFCTGTDSCRDGACKVHLVEDCSSQGPCFYCDAVLDACEPIAACATPTPTQTPEATSTPKPLPMAECPVPLFNEATYNVNGANCTFCRDINVCSLVCLGPPACFCPTDGSDPGCCAANPCCENCPEAGSLDCTKLTCTCTPSDAGCCATLCPCSGDCGGDGNVTVDELVRGVRIVGNMLPLASCVSFSPSGSGVIGVEHIVLAVQTALGGCI